MAPPAQAQSNDATLSIIRSFPGGWTLEPAFQRTRYVYFVRASSHSTRIRVTKSHARATVRITPDDDRSSPDWALFEIGSSVREVQVRVTAEDGNTTRTYRIYFLRDRPVPSHELRLHAGLLLSTLRLSVDAGLVAVASGTPTPGDCGCGTEYRVTVPKGTGRISVYAEGRNDNVRIRTFFRGDRLGTAVPAATPRLEIEGFTVYAQQGNRTEIYDIEVFLATHDGSSEFSFRIEFSDEPHGYSYTTLRDHTLDIRQGSRLTPKVRRVTSGSNRHWEVTVTPTSSADITIRVNETSNCNADGAVCTEDDRMLLDGIDHTVTGPAGFSVADARVSEGSDVTLDFVVTLSRTPTGTETVDYETIDGTANAGTDYTAQSGTLSFSAGTTSMTVSVPVLDDSHDEDEETLTLRLSNASTNLITDAEATGTIENHDPLPQALMARFGRTAAVHVVEQIEERLAAPREPGFDGRIAGRELGRGMGSDMALQFLRQFGGNGSGHSGFRGPRTAMAGARGMTTQAAMPGAVGNMAGPLGVRSMGSALGTRAGVPHPGGAADGAALGLSDMGLGGEGLLTGSGFALNRPTRGGGMLSIWSRGVQSSFAGQEGAGLAVDLRVRMLVMHQAEGFRERGMTVSLRYNPRPSTPLGFHARVTPTWGGEAGGTAALWHQESMGSLAYGRGEGNRVDAEMGYGLPVGDDLVGTPQVAVRASEYGNDYRVGYALGLLERGNTSFSVNIGLHQREVPMLGETNRGFASQATLGW